MKKASGLATPLPGITFKPRSTREAAPTPEDEWSNGRVLRVFIDTTRSRGDPRVTVRVELHEGYDSGVQSALVDFEIIFFDANELPRAARMHRQRLRELSHACDSDLARFIPDEISRSADLQAFIDHLEGRALVGPMWTVRTQDTRFGERTELRFRRPAAGLASRDDWSDD